MSAVRHARGRYFPDTRNKRVLNVGSGGVRLPGDCVNTDIVDGPNVDYVFDAGEMWPWPEMGMFDVIVFNASLQYIRDPAYAIWQAAEVLRPGGELYIDAPWMQPYCVDGLDLWRFSESALRRMAGRADLRNVTAGTSIAAGSAIAFHIEKSLDVGPRWMSAGLRLAARPFLSLLARVELNDSTDVAGAVWLRGFKL